MGTYSEALHIKTRTCAAALIFLSLLSFLYTYPNIHLKKAIQYIRMDFLQGFGLVANQSLSFNKPDHDIFWKSRKVPLVNCRKLFDGDQSEMKKAYNLMKANNSRRTIFQEYLSISESCESFRETRGYIMSPLTSLEDSFPLAYSILMYRDVYQVERLLRTIYRPQNIYCIHVDSKAKKDVKYTMKKISSCFDNVFIASQSFDVRWGTMTVIEPEMICMRDILEKNKRWKYFINLTGQEFPLRTNFELVKILMAYDGANDIQGSRHRSNVA
ncbi:hypothetical protein CHS0354_008341 [Potamilus streckersoni]|uniref:Uncharacterized protein n=1 Tax=Potamilus streckersoni TaxID=2493646 RepID=A0AAE0SCQ9_9BIVA|nr:hypothetical protein CHS0354_008341 [Potamilus streckersoni]